MARNRIGFHLGTGGNKNGYGDYIRALDAAGIPAFVGSMAGEGFGDVKARWDAGSQVNHVVVVRYMPDGGQDVPRYGIDYNTAVNDWLTWYIPKIGQDVRAYHQRVITKHGNELDKNQLVWLSGFYPKLHAELLRRMGWASHRICCFSFASGEPEPEQWEQPAVLDFLRLAGDNPDKFVIGLHEYSYADVLTEIYPHRIGRFQKLYEICDKHGIKRPLIAIHEFGWRQDTMPDPTPAMEQIQTFAAPLYCQYETVLGAAIWTTQQGFNNIANKAQKLIRPVQDMTLNVTFPDPVPPDPPTPPTGDCMEGDYKSVVWLIPQEVDGNYWGEIAVRAHDTYKRTLTASDKNARVMACDGNHESHVIVWEPEYPSQKAAIDMLEAAGITVLFDYLSGNPLDGLRLGHLFAYAYQYTSRFNDARDYDGDRVYDDAHEGVDCDFIGGKTNNTEMVLCAYDGVVERSIDSTGNYGKYVRVRHERNGKPFLTWYCHLDSRVVQEGQSVTKGQPVGEVGTSGRVTGEHVHFNLVAPGFGATPPPGKSPYAITDVVDPAPYLPTPAEMNGLPPVPTGTTYDMTRYLFGKRDGRALQLSSGETVQYQEAGGLIYCVKNSQWEQFRYDGSYIWRGKDTSPGPAPSYAERPGQLRYYWQTETGQNAARWCPRYMTVGQTWHGFGHHVQYFYKSDCWASNANSGSATNKATLIAHHPTKTWGNLTVHDVLEFKGVGDEHFWLILDWGMGGWSADWGESHATELFQPGQRTLTRESGCYG